MSLDLYWNPKFAFIILIFNQNSNLFNSLYTSAVIVRFISICHLQPYTFAANQHNNSLTDIRQMSVIYKNFQTYAEQSSKFVSLQITEIVCQSTSSSCLSLSLSICLSLSVCPANIIQDLCVFQQNDKCIMLTQEPIKNKAQSEERDRQSEH